MSCGWEEVINTLRLYIVTAQVQKALDLTLWDLDLDLRLEFGIGLVNILQTVSKKINFIKIVCLKNIFIIE